MLANIKLTKKRKIANGTMAFHFEKPAGLEYRAGQFADFTLIDPPETDAEGDTRGFSLVAAPSDNEIIFATRMRDTAFKRVLGKLPWAARLNSMGLTGTLRFIKRRLPLLCS